MTEADFTLKKKHKRKIPHGLNNVIRRAFKLTPYSTPRIKFKARLKIFQVKYFRLQTLRLC